ncbi:hypothetical protein STEG23_009540 [Scotinomys teguina]
MSKSLFQAPMLLKVPHHSHEENANLDCFKILSLFTCKQHHQEKKCHQIMVLPSITTEILKSVVACFDAGELIIQRELVSGQVSDDLTERAAMFGLFLDDLSLIHLTFGKKFTEAVETKQVAQQEAERLRCVVEKAELQKKAAIISAEGDSKAAKLIANSLATQVMN